jgi:hypothetical protein
MNLFIYFLLQSVVLAQLSIPAWHPDIDMLLATRAKAVNHPLIHQALSDASRGFGEDDHPNCDRLIANGRGLPRGHPKMSRYVTYQTFQLNPKPISVPFWHPAINESLSKPLSPGHPKVHQMFINFMPKSHPDIDTLFAQGRASNLPQWHPGLDQFIGTSGQRPKAIQLPVWHRKIYLT